MSIKRSKKTKGEDEGKIYLTIAAIKFCVRKKVLWMLVVVGWLSDCGIFVCFLVILLQELNEPTTIKRETNVRYGSD